jgi:hypothetical protein
MGETITGVALLCSDGRMFSLPQPSRHGHLFALAALMGIDPEPCHQGFTTSWGRFVDREGARNIVTANGQPCRQTGDKLELYSEDLW